VGAVGYESKSLVEVQEDTFNKLFGSHLGL